LSKRDGRMSETTRLISFLTLLLAVLLPSIALFALDSKGLVRIVFALVLIVGYDIVFLHMQTGR